MRFHILSHRAFYDSNRVVMICREGDRGVSCNSRLNYYWCTSLPPTSYVKELKIKMRK